MSRDRIRLALDVYAAKAELDEALAALSAADPTDDPEWEAARTREMNARGEYVRELEKHFEATHDRFGLAQSLALAVCQLTF